MRDMLGSKSSRRNTRTVGIPRRIPVGGVPKLIKSATDGGGALVVGDTEIIVDRDKNSSTLDPADHGWLVVFQPALPFLNTFLLIDTRLLKLDVG